MEEMYHKVAMADRTACAVGQLPPPYNNRLAKRLLKADVGRRRVPSSQLNIGGGAQWIRVNKPTSACSLMIVRSGYRIRNGGPLQCIFKLVQDLLAFCTLLSSRYFHYSLYFLLHIGDPVGELMYLSISLTTS